MNEYTTKLVEAYIEWLDLSGKATIAHTALEDLRERSS